MRFDNCIFLKIYGTLDLAEELEKKTEIEESK